MRDPMTQRRAAGFITSLNALRFFAAVAIVIFHFGRWSWPFTLPWLQPHVLISNTGVTFFFVLSGFIMVYVYGQKFHSLSWTSVAAFYRARIARIVPLYLAALVLMVGGMWAVQEPFTLKSFILQLLFLQSWVPGEGFTLNFAGWTLSVEMMFYALFPLILTFFLRKGWRWACGTTAILWLCGNALTIGFAFAFSADPTLADVWLKVFPPLHLNSFLIGMLAGIWYQKKKTFVHPGLVWLSVAVLAVYPFIVPANLNVASHNGLFAPLFAILILAITPSSSFIARALSIKPLVAGGDISYGVYILQAPIYAWVYYSYTMLDLYKPLGEEGRFFIYLLILCVASWISFVTIETWGKKLIRGKEA